MRTIKDRVRKVIEKIKGIEDLCNNPKTCREVRRSNKRKLRPLYRQLERLKKATK